MTLYEQIGQAKIDKITKSFYQSIESDEVIRPMYPKEIKPAEERMRLFLIQVFGGPMTYTEQRGHPRLRRRHFPYSIDMNARQRWMMHMLKALKEAELEQGVEEKVIAYFEQASLHMINS